ncbi:MAG: type II toxin-antitoxin system VapC family toxin [Gemmatimonadota bacterium]|nr:type II toxin-antitoxin system VapC family toxin [Gemmatimonadota bacterium]MDE2863871.1 type II toxin-antitoxin system VapC family toxin [Gemmatimonadota bacterium]MYE17112.1 type II toxin-antitoxin system VapC family toxin [Gemmatimonadota bacterium]
MNVVDSSAWLEYFADGPNAGEFAEVVFETERLIVPSVTLFEVFKRIRGQRDLDSALYAVAQMQRGKVIDLDANLAIAAAELSAESGLPMAHGIILATARAHEAVLWTQDSDFNGLERVEYRSVPG